MNKVQTDRISNTCFLNPRLLKTWEKIAVVAALVVAITLALLVTLWSRAPIPQLAGYIEGGSLAAVTLMIALALIIYRKNRQGAEPPITEETPSPVTPNHDPQSPQPPKSTNSSPPIVNLPNSQNAVEILNHALTYIDSLSFDERDDYTKEELKEDFQLAYQQEGEKAGSRLQAMFKALPYHLGKSPMPNPSPYEAVGIPNHHGNNCFLNSALQILAHTPNSDYALLRPLHEPKEPIQPIATDEPTCPARKEIFVDQEISSYASAKIRSRDETWEQLKGIYIYNVQQRVTWVKKTIHNEQEVVQLEHLLHAYNEAPSNQTAAQIENFFNNLEERDEHLLTKMKNADQEFEKMQKNYNEKLAIWRQDNLKVDEYNNILKPKYNEQMRALKARPLLLKMVENLRKGTPPSKEEVEQLFAIMCHEPGNLGATSHIFRLFHYYCPQKYQIESLSLKNVDEFRAQFPRMTSPIFIMGGHGHYKVYVTTKKGAYSINDSGVSKITIQQQAICENFRQWTPELIFANYQKKCVR